MTRPEQGRPPARGARRRMSPQLSRRIRALLACGVLLGTGAFGTAALWSTTPTTVSGAFTTANLEIKANGSRAYTFTFPGALLPGDSTAFIVNVQNTGSIAFTYVGAVSSSTTLGQAVSLTARAGGTTSGTTCTGGTALVANKTITGIPSNFRTASGPIAASNGAESLCLQLNLPTTAAATLAGSSGAVLFTFTATGV